MTVRIADLMQTSGVKFGTSGARGLVTAMTDRVCYAYTAAFLQHLQQQNRTSTGCRVAIAGDLRPSTGRIARAVSAAVSDRGYLPVACGRIPSPAVALFGLHERIPAIMVTGSHIPDDRNGIKFNAPEGEILKDDEASMRAQVVDLPDRFDDAGWLRGDSEPEPAVDFRAGRAYVRRFTSAFPSNLLADKRIGLYAHSAVGRDLMHEVYEALGAEVVRLADSEEFVPVDTEAIRPEDVTLAAEWSKDLGLDAILSSDGDSDRPLIADERGRWMRGDVAGILCARQLGADTVVVPVSCNSAVDACGAFEKVVRTRIGSPYVIEAMNRAVASGSRCVVGYEANGGFLTATPVNVPEGSLSPLPTRDAIIVHLAILWAAASRDCTISQLLESLPPRFTWSDRLKDMPTEVSRSKLEAFRDGGLTVIGKAFAAFGSIESVDWTDGMRMQFAGGTIVHVRPSGNAPELRCYTEASTEEEARTVSERAMEQLVSWR